MIFDPKKGGVVFFCPPPPTSLKSSKKWVSSGGGGGSGTFRTKNSLGDALVGQNYSSYKGLKEQFNPLGKGTRIGPKRPKMGQYVAVSPIYACLALI